MFTEKQGIFLREIYAIVDVTFSYFRIQKVIIFKQRNIHVKINVDNTIW